MAISVTLPEDFIEATPRSVKNRSEYDLPGVYVFFDKNDIPLYVGKTVSFKRRFGQHALISEFFDLSTKARLYVVKSEYEKDIYETHLISELKPEYNKAKTFYTRLEYEDAIHALEMQITELREEIAELETCLREEMEMCDEDEESIISLGEVLLVQDRIRELEREIKGLQSRKSALLGRLSA